MASAHTALQDAFALADDVLRQGVQVGRGAVRTMESGKPR